MQPLVLVIPCNTCYDYIGENLRNFLESLQEKGGVNATVKFYSKENQYKFQSVQDYVFDDGGASVDYISESFRSSYETRQKERDELGYHSVATFSLVVNQTGL
jgi:hypothetical protein